MDMRNLASIASIALGVVLVLGGVITWGVVSSTLSDQRITVPDEDEACLGGRTVSGPFTAYCMADIIEQHTLTATDGLTYAEMEREDPRRDVAMNSSFLQASLFTSILAFGVAAMAAGMGVLFILIGLGMRDVRQQVTGPPAEERTRV
jgi:hypothetical protein